VVTKREYKYEYMLLGQHDMLPPFVFNPAPTQSHKRLFSCFLFSKRSVLIDDRESLRENWEGAGGIFVHHVNADTTLQKLKELRIVEEQQ
jgi:hypothetical protein